MINPRTKRIVVMIMGMAITAVVVLLVFAIVTAATKSTDIRNTQEGRSGQVASNDQILERIESCTTPGRGCYERAQRQTAKAVGDINLVIVYAAACASGSTLMTAEQIQTCVLDRLAEKPR